MQVKEKPEAKIEKRLENKHNLILYNDEVNTFEHVIDCLVSICNHTETQAEQCAYITHNKGKCIIKKGSLSTLKLFFSALQLQGLTVEIK